MNTTYFLTNGFDEELSFTINHAQISQDGQYLIMLIEQHQNIIDSENNEQNNEYEVLDEKAILFRTSDIIQYIQLNNEKENILLPDLMKNNLIPYCYLTHPTAFENNFLLYNFIFNNHKLILFCSNQQTKILNLDILNLGHNNDFQTGKSYQLSIEKEIQHPLKAINDDKFKNAIIAHSIADTSYFFIKNKFVGETRINDNYESYYVDMDYLLNHSEFLILDECQDYGINDQLVEEKMLKNNKELIDFESDVFLAKLQANDKQYLFILDVNNSILKIINI